MFSPDVSLYVVSIYFISVWFTRTIDFLSHCTLEYVLSISAAAAYMNYSMRASGL